MREFEPVILSDLTDIQRTLIQEVLIFESNLNRMTSSDGAGRLLLISATNNYNTNDTILRTSQAIILDGDVTITAQELEDERHKNGR